MNKLLTALTAGLFVLSTSAFAADVAKPAAAPAAASAATEKPATAPAEKPATAPAKKSKHSKKPAN